MSQPSRRLVAAVVNSMIMLCGFCTTASAQQRGAIFADVGFASIGHADSEQGKAPLIGGGVSFRLTPWLVAEGDVHRAHVSHVFGRDDHDFTELTTTGSLLFRAFRAGRAHLLAGGGLAVQRAHIEFDVSPVRHVERSETIRLVHGRAGIEWDASDRIVLRSDGVLWFGSGLDWVFGGLLRVGYRF
jgi:hypothetical protein